MIRTLALALAIVFGLLLVIADVQRADDMLQAQAEKPVIQDKAPVREVMYADLDKLPKGWKQ